MCWVFHIVLIVNVALFFPVTVVGNRDCLTFLPSVVIPITLCCEFLESVVWFCLFLDGANDY